MLPEAASFTSPDFLCRLRERTADLLHHPTELFELQSTSLLYELCCLTLAGHGTRTLASGDGARQKTEQAIHWYLNNIHVNPGLEEVAEAVFLSLSHLRRLFYRVHHKSPQRVLNELRMEEAAQRLCQFADPERIDQQGMSAMGLDGIAHDLSFSSASSLSRAFKKHFGCSPRSYRAKFLNGLKHRGSA